MKPSASRHTLSTKQAIRYSRQILLPGFDLDKQELLLNSAVLLIGAGGLGCAAAQYLVAAGIGKLTMVDDDTVELSNLQRQVLHVEQSLGQLKTVSAATRLKALNDDVMIETFTTRLHDVALSKQIEQHTVVVDCSDNLATRNQLNRLCFSSKTPLVSGAAIRMEGQVCCFDYQQQNACYQCLSATFGEQNLSCMEAGVLSPVVGIIGAMQALETIKLLSDFGNPVVNKLMMFDAMTGEWQTFNLLKNPQCQVCG